MDIGLHIAGGDNSLFYFLTLAVGTHGLSGTSTKRHTPLCQAASQLEEVQGEAKRAQSHS